jgi:hypothetical protein
MQLRWLQTHGIVATEPHPTERHAVWGTPILLFSVTQMEVVNRIFREYHSGR